MLNLYAVHGGTSLFAIVQAESEEEALDVFVESQLDEKTFRDEVDSFTTNMSLLERFYKDEHGHFIEVLQENTKKELQKWRRKSRKNISIIILKRTRRLSGKKPLIM